MAVAGEPEAVQALRQTLDAWLRRQYPDVEVDADGDFVVRPGGSAVWIRPAEWTDGQTLVHVWAITNLGVPVTPELTRFVAVENLRILFGRLRLDEEEEAVLLSETLLGDFLNRRELEVAVDAVAQVAGAYREAIEQRFGERPVARPVPLVARNLKAWQATFGFLSLVAAVPAAIYAYSLAHSIWLGVFVGVLVMQLVGRGVCDVLTDPNKVQRALYFPFYPALCTGVLWGVYEAWGRWWLAVVVGLAGGLLLGAVLMPLLFPRIHREEVEDSSRRLGTTTT